MSVRVPAHCQQTHTSSPPYPRWQRWTGPSGLELKHNSRWHRKGVAPQLSSSCKRRRRREQEEKAKHGWSVSHQRYRWIGVDVGDISWWVAAAFTLGSVWWCIQGILYFGYFSNSSQTFVSTEYAMAFLGGTTFLFGSYLGFVEALNPARDSDFGWVVNEEAHMLIEPERAPHALGRKRRHFGRHEKPVMRESEEALTRPGGRNDEDKSTSQRWRWWGYAHSIGYAANAIQLFGAVWFEISVICGLPGVLPEASEASTTVYKALWISLYWLPQVIGSPCFFIPGIMFMLEVQPKWYKLRPLRMGWQIGFWNFLGGIGFWLCGIFGLVDQAYGGTEGHPIQYYGTALSTFWGSWCFLIGSYIQLLESLNKRA